MPHSQCSFALSDLGDCLPAEDVNIEVCDDEEASAYLSKAFVLFGGGGRVARLFQSGNTVWQKPHHNRISNPLTALGRRRQRS